jgi:hypothetical protein
MSRARLGSRTVPFGNAQGKLSGRNDHYKRILGFLAHGRFELPCRFEALLFPGWIQDGDQPDQPHIGE